MIGLCEVRCSDTNISSLIAAKPSRSTSMVKRSVLIGAPPAQRPRSWPLLQDQVARLVLARGLPGQDQRGGGGFLDHARPGDPRLKLGAHQDGDLPRASVRVEIDQAGPGGRRRTRITVVCPADVSGRLDGADPERDDLEWRVEPDRVAVQAPLIERGADAGECGRIRYRDFERVLLPR